MTSSDAVPPRLLRLLPYDSCMLRAPSHDVSFPLSDADLQLVRDMQFSIQPQQLSAAQAPWPSAAGMAAVQWGCARRIFLWHPSQGPQFEACFNPSYSAVGAEAVDGEEGCFSVPGARGLVQRWRRVLARWMDAEGNACERELEDWPARVWQHETDHTMGFLYDDERAGRCLRKTAVAVVAAAAEEEDTHPQLR